MTDMQLYNFQFWHISKYLYFTCISRNFLALYKFDRKRVYPGKINYVLRTKATKCECIYYGFKPFTVTWT